MSTWFKRIGYGVAIWALLFVAAIPLLGLNESDPIAFKALMAFLGSLVGAIAATAYFLTIHHNYLRESLITAAVWVAINWLLDYVILLPFTGETVSQYFMHIGIEYVGIFGMLIAIGYLLEKKTKTAPVQ